MGQAGQRAGATDAKQEGSEVAADGRARDIVMLLEDDPLGAFLDRFLDEEEQPPHRDIAPFWIGTEGPGAEHSDPAAVRTEVADDVDVGGVEDVVALAVDHLRSEEHTSELQSLMRISYAVFCLKKKKKTNKPK